MPATQPSVDPRAVRERLVEALRLDLGGPWAGHELAAEQLPGRERPLDWYVAGFLIPTGTPPKRSADADEDEDLDTAPELAGLAAESNEGRKAAHKGYFLSSIGLGLLVATGCWELAVTERWGDYAPPEIEKAGGGAKTPVWRLTPHEAVLAVPLGGSAGPEVRSVPGSGGLQLHVDQCPIDAMGGNAAELPAGRRWVSCFLVNRRTPEEAQPGCANAFPAEIEVRADEGFAPRPDLRGAHAAEWDDRVADLHCIDTPEHATGHGASAECVLEDGRCRTIRAAWIGAAEVQKQAASTVPRVALSMELLGWLHGGAAVGQALSFLVKRYSGLRRRDVESCPLQGARQDTADPLHYATVADAGMARGVPHLGEDAGRLEAVRVASRAVVCTRRHPQGDQSGPEGPRWPAVEIVFLPRSAPRPADLEDRHSGRPDRLTLPIGADHRRASGPVTAAVVLRPLRPCFATTGCAGIRGVRHYASRARVANGPLARASNGAVPTPEMSGAMPAQPSRAAEPGSSSNGGPAGGLKLKARLGSDGVVHGTRGRNDTAPQPHHGASEPRRNRTPTCRTPTIGVRDP